MIAITVHAGDTLSALALEHGESLRTIEADNRQIRNPNLIYAGEKVYVTSGTTYSAPQEPSETTYAPAPVQQTPSSVPAVSAAPGSFQQCVISRESGGDPNVMNSSGHYGLYQFSESTWEAYGGSASDFGNASVAEQNQVFDNAIAAGGESNWSAYDGC